MIDEYLTKIIRDIQETEEEFIYTSVKPYCESVVGKISKEELKNALLKSKPVEPIIHYNSPDDLFPRKCPVCFAPSISRYCSNCGQRLKVPEDEKEGE